MDKPQDKSSQSKGPGGDGSPMAMGMGMAKKMMAQMGAGGSPMEMMQKMMAQMGQGEGKPPMEKMMGMCLGMCAEMLASIRNTTALAVSATPELQRVFGEWLKQMEDEALNVIGDSATDAAALASALKISEGSARYVMGRLAEQGKIKLTAGPTQ
jgi:hypothetical protein